MNGQSTVSRLTDPSLPTSQRQPALRDFANRFGWRPSDALLDYPGIESYANGHLVVEHGLDNTAVITFLKTTHPYSSLTYEDRLKVLAISYNNLVDWHVFPEPDGATTVYNRLRPLIPKRVTVYEMPEVWRADSFDQITADHPPANLKNLDQALVETVSVWKRSLAAELGHQVAVDNISALFNAIFFVRALEDQRRFESPNTDRLLLDRWEQTRSSKVPFTACIATCLDSLGAASCPETLIEMSLLSPFNNLDHDTVGQLLRDFYHNRFAPYHYDFSLMSKHALSRIYEKYVALLQPRESSQRTLFPDLPNETIDTSAGAVYTPQYIARFFSRYLRDNVTPRAFRTMRVADPACGSGIFLRTILEMQCDPFQFEGVTKETVSAAFSRTIGIDWDKNACHATRLSLALLHIVLTGEFPRDLDNIVAAEAIEYYQNHPDLREAFDALIANPPFIKWDHLQEPLRQRVADFMDGLTAGKPDMFLAHLKLGLEMVRPSGFLLFVLPHSFLIGRNAAGIRARIAKDFWVRCIVDLSEIPVFGDVGSYVVLLILQRQGDVLAPPPPAVIVRCREFVGQALCDALEGRTVSNEFYQVYEADQKRFAVEQWSLLPPQDSRLRDKVLGHVRLGEFLYVREGFVSGADDVFIVDSHRVPEGEESLYLPFLGDREMRRFHVPATTSQMVFYPYIEGEPVTEKVLSGRFRKTWHYLCEQRERLSQRASVVKGDFPWWRPERPRPPSSLLVPKIVTPHLVVMPRFSLDQDGKYAVSRCPLMFPRQHGADVELLMYFVAVLNSPISLWQLVHMSHKYRRGYAMLEPRTLREMMVPDPAKVPLRKMNRIQKLVSKRLESPEDAKVEREIDGVVADLYGLTTEEREMIGMED